MALRYQNFVYETDTQGSWGLGQTKVDMPLSGDVSEVFALAQQLGGRLVVKPSRGKYLYIKGFNMNKSYCDIIEHLRDNVAIGYKPKSRTYLLFF